MGSTAASMMMMLSVSLAPFSMWSQVLGSLDKQPSNLSLSNFTLPLTKSFNRSSLSSHNLIFTPNEGATSVAPNLIDRMALMLNHTTRPANRSNLVSSDDKANNCGQAPLNSRAMNTSIPYILGGMDQVYGEWPQFASISVERYGSIYPLCSGVILSSRHILTAGHCIIGENGRERQVGDLTVTTGDHSTKLKDKHERTFRVRSSCKSEAYARSRLSRFRNDFALLRLAEPIEPFDNYTQPACKPTSNLADYKRRHCHVVGVGYTFEDPIKGVSFPNIVQVMDVKETSCEIYDGAEKRDPSQFCWTKSTGNGTTCHGDSGGPILCLNDQNSWTVVGLVSFAGIYCDGQEIFGYSGVYTKVEAVLDQINECIP